MTTPDPFPSELVEAAAKAVYNIEEYVDEGPAWTDDFLPSNEWQEESVDIARAVLAAVLPLIEQRVSRDAYPQAWRYGAAEENARIVAALRAKGTHAADVLADQIEMEAP